MTKAHTKKPGLRNPALIATASSPEGQKAIGGAIEVSKIQAETASKVVGDVVPFVIKTAIVIGLGYVVYRMYTHRFVKLGTNPNLEPANVSDGQASARAASLYEAMYGFGANKQMAAEALAGLNHNGFIKVYNAFGNKAAANPPFTEMNLIDWINDQFSGDDLSDLRFVLPNEF